MEAAQLLDVAHVLGVEQRLGVMTAARDALAARALASSSAIALRKSFWVSTLLEHHLQMERAQEARRLAQDRDDARVRLQLGDRAWRSLGADVLG